MLQLARRQSILQQIKNRPAKILRRRNAIGKKRIEIQVGMVESVQDSRSHRFIERHKIDHHSRFIGNRAAHQYLDKIIVPMSVLVVALSVRGAVFFRSQRRRIQPMAGAQHITSAKIRLHASPLYSAKISGVS